MSTRSWLRAFSVLAGTMIASQAPAKPLAIVDALVYPSATAAPVPHVTILIEDGRIIAVAAQVPIPPDADVIRCNGCAVMAGFWNCHIHFSEPKWEDAATKPAQKLAEQLQSMLGRAGFTTVVDTGSLLPNTVALRRRIESGEIPGPRILTAGVPIYPPDGLPYYVKDSVPPAILKQLSLPRDAMETAVVASANLQNGADLLKLFTGAWISRMQVVSMPEPMATAAVAVAHKQHRLVFSHPSNLAGIQVAMACGVDVLAHAPDDTRGVDDGVLRKAIANHMALIPTLKLFSGANNIADIRRIVRRFHELGGKLMFGTDTGYLTDYDVSMEFQQLEKTGLHTADILSMLTENPAQKFGVQEERGRIMPGMTADLTILESDPSADLMAFSRVRYAIRSGRIISASQK